MAPTRRYSGPVQKTSIRLSKYAQHCTTLVVFAIVGLRFSGKDYYVSSLSHTSSISLSLISTLTHILSLYFFLGSKGSLARAVGGIFHGVN